jgi:hypothetical protein
MNDSLRLLEMTRGKGLKKQEKIHPSLQLQFINSGSAQCMPEAFPESRGIRFRLAQIIPEILFYGSDLSISFQNF